MLEKFPIELELKFTGMFLLGKVMHNCWGEECVFHPNKTKQIPAPDDGNEVSDQWGIDILEDDFLSLSTASSIPIGPYKMWHIELEEKINTITIIRYVLIGNKLYEFPDIVRER